MNTIKNCDWIKKTLCHMDSVSVPYNFSFTPPALDMIENYYGGHSIEKVCDFPIRMIAPISIKPLYADPEVHGNTIRDEFGVVWTTSKTDRGVPIYYCLTEDNFLHYEFPDPDKSYRFDGISEWCKSNCDNFTVIWVGDLWERATFMRGMESILMDLSYNPPFVEELIKRITLYILRTMEILFDRFFFDAVAISDDYGTQRSLIMSPTDWRRFIKPSLAKIYAFAKKNGKTVFHHSCGNIYPIIGDMIDIGLDILHPVQPEAMDITKLKKEFGRHITFCGGINTQSLLPFGKPSDVRDEVRRLKNEIGSGGGYILETGITVQADVPLENVVAMIDDARNNFIREEGF